MQLSTEEFIKRYGIALSGGIATGKSTVAKILRQRGFTVIDADQLSRRVFQPGHQGLKEIVVRLGSEILNSTGELDRRLLKDVIFSDPAKKSALEAITHPLIRAELHSEVQKLMEKQAEKVFFYEAALIVESGQKDKFRELWVTDCPRELQLQRLMARDGMSREFAEKVLAGQLAAPEKVRAADRVINTDCDLPTLQKRIDALLELVK